MKELAHLKSLKIKHGELEKLIKTASDYLQNETKVKNLKKQKLLLKERIDNIETRM